MIHFMIAVSSVFGMMSVLALIGCELVYNAQKIADALGIDWRGMGKRMAMLGTERREKYVTNALSPARAAL